MSRKVFIEKQGDKYLMEISDARTQWQFMNEKNAAVYTATELFVKLRDVVDKWLKGKPMVVNGIMRDEYFEFLVMGPDENKWHEYTPSVQVSDKFMEFVKDSKKHGLEFAGAHKLAEELVTNGSTKLYFSIPSERKSGRTFSKTV